MARKRKNKFVRKIHCRNKILKKDDFVQRFLNDHSLIDNDIQYCFLEFDLHTNFNIPQDKDNSIKINLLTLNFDVPKFVENLNFKEILRSTLLFTSNDSMWLLFNEDYYQDYYEICFAHNSYSHIQRLIKALTNKKVFQIEGLFQKSSNNSWCLLLKVYLLHTVIFTSFDTFLKNYFYKNDATLAIMSHLFGYPVHDTNSSKNINENSSIEQFYYLLYQNQDFSDSNINLNKSSDLIPSLRNYQELAVKWMLKREKNNILYEHQDLFVKHCFENIYLFYHKILGHFISEDVYREYMFNCKISTGGILADEMGLGKTIETLALIFNNKKVYNDPQYEFFTKSKLFSLSENPIYGTLQCYCGIENVSVIETYSIEHIMETSLAQKYYLNTDLIKCLLCANYQHFDCSNYEINEHNFPYLCSRCWLKVDPIDSGCTLIVCPNSILQQWIDEIQKNVRNIRILKYNGVKSKDYIFPPILANNDIVLTTYDILRSEVDYSSTHSYGHLRNKKRYYSPTSPLLCVKWWRLCFDEAQLVEGTFTRAAKMANSLISNYRWAITGTPIQKSINDLYGLLYFIQEEPFCQEIIWNNALYFPFCKGNSLPLIKTLNCCFWRTPKNQVLKEIGISNPIVYTKKLEFSQIERDFYQKQATLAQNLIFEKLKNIDANSKLSDLSSAVQGVILNSALKLRQTCCHPQVCMNNSLPVKQFSSLQDVLNKMIEDTKYDCEKNHREKIAALNGISALSIQMNHFKNAIETYRSGLDSVNTYKEFFRTDKTQIYHIYYNLAQILEFYGCLQVDSSGNQFGAFNGEQYLDNTTLHDASQIDIQKEDQFFRMKAKQIYEKYILNEKLACITTEKYRLEQIKKCNSLLKTSNFNGKWFIYALKSLTDSLDSNEIEQSIIQSSNLNSEFNSIYSGNSVNSLKFILNNYLSDIENSRRSMLNIFEKLQSEILDQRNVEKYIQCHIKLTSPTKCSLCLANPIFRNYEKNLFNVQYKSVEDSDDNIIAEGNWNESNYLQTFRRIGQLFKTKAFSVSDFELIVEDIDNFFAYIDETKKEFKTHRKLWTNLSEFILRIDELNQAQTRYSMPILYGEDSSENAIQTFMHQKYLFEQDQTQAEVKLKTNLNRLKYLVNLKNSLKDKNDVESRMCSICWCEMKKYFLLTCGHFFCVDCMMSVEKHSDGATIKCSVCRAQYKKEALCCIDSTSEPSKASVIGSWSTKIVNIIRCILKILDSNEKILIFSSWIKMLEIMQTALETNQIKSSIVSGADRNFSKKIKQFQMSSSESVLLLPTNFACKGLNLTEASHVIFINSSLNKADELQAIGRIHRIGQTRQTYVHKFIIKDTIEELIENHNEKVYHKSNTKNSEFNNLTVGQFCNLFYN